MRLLFAGLALVTVLAVDSSSQEGRPLGRVSGSVTQEGTKTPVSGARVFLVPDGPPSPPFGPPATTMTDQNGRYVLDAVPAGRYVVSAQKPTFAPAMDPSGTRMVQLAAGQTLEGVDISLQKGGVITGRVLDPSGEPMIEARVTVLLKRLAAGGLSAPPPGGGAPIFAPFGGGQTNDLGEFRVYGLPPGEYLVAADPKTDMGDPIGLASPSALGHTFFGGVADAASARSVSIRSGDIVSDVEIRLIAVQAFAVSGIVVDDMDAPVAGATVMLMTDPSKGSEGISMFGPRGISTADANGRFAIEGVVAGSYVLTALEGGGGGGAFAGVIGDFVIGADGVPRADTSQPQAAPRWPGSVDVTVESANISDLKIVVRRR